MNTDSIAMPNDLSCLQRMHNGVGLRAARLRPLDPAEEFFVFLRYHVGWGGRARDLVERVTRRLAHVPNLLSLTERQLSLYCAHSGEPGFEAVNGFPCLFTVDERQAVPMTLITEDPNETVQGEAFQAAHRAQMKPVLAAYDALQEMADCAL